MRWANNQENCQHWPRIGTNAESQVFRRIPQKDIMLHDLQRNIYIIYFVTHDTFYDTNIFVDYIYCVPTRVMREIGN